MGANSKIEWTEATWNCIRGCSRVSKGCEHCYAEREAWRHAGPGDSYEGLVQITNGHPQWTGEVRFIEEHLRDPLKWKKPRRIFVNSMSDLFHEGVAGQHIDQIFAVMALASQHTFQVLTKRPERMLAQLRRLAASINPLEKAARALGYTFKFTSPLDGKEHSTLPWPIPNIVLGVSVESPKHRDRIDILRETPAAVRMLSLEPLLEDLGKLELRGIHWVIVGGESGPGARPCDIQWIRSIRDQCKAAGVPCFVKQLGSEPGVHKNDKDQSGLVFFHHYDNKAEMFIKKLKDKKGGDPSEWPVDLRVREYPQRAGDGAPSPARS